MWSCWGECNVDSGERQRYCVSVESLLSTPNMRLPPASGAVSSDCERADTITADKPAHTQSAPCALTTSGEQAPPSNPSDPAGQQGSLISFDPASQQGPPSSIAPSSREDVHWLETPVSDAPRQGALGAIEGGRACEPTGEHFSLVSVFVVAVLAFLAGGLVGILCYLVVKCACQAMKGPACVPDRTKKPVREQHCPSPPALSPNNSNSDTNSSSNSRQSQQSHMSQQSQTSMSNESESEPTAARRFRTHSSPRPPGLLAGQRSKPLAGHAGNALSRETSNNAESTLNESVTIPVAYVPNSAASNVPNIVPSHAPNIVAFRVGNSVASHASPWPFPSSALAVASNTLGAPGASNTLFPNATLRRHPRGSRRDQSPAARAQRTFARNSIPLHRPDSQPDEEMGLMGEAPFLSTAQALISPLQQHAKFFAPEAGSSMSAGRQGAPRCRAARVLAVGHDFNKVPDFPERFEIIASPPFLHHPFRVAIRTG